MEEERKERDTGREREAREEWSRFGGKLPKLQHMNGCIPSPSQTVEQILLWQAVPGGHDESDVQWE